MLADTRTAKCQLVYEDSDLTVVDSSLGPKTEFGILPGLSFTEIYWNQNDGFNSIISKNPSIISSSSDAFIEPGPEISVYQKIKLLKFLALSIDLGLSYTAENTHYGWSTADSSGTSHSSMVYTITTEQGETPYRILFIPATVAIDVYPVTFGNIYFHIGIRPEFTLLDYGTTNYVHQTLTYTHDTLGYQHILSNSNQPGSKKVSVGNSISGVYGLGILVNRKHRPMHVEMDYSQSLAPYKANPAPFRLGAIDIKLGIKV